MKILAECREKPKKENFDFEEGKHYWFETDENYTSFMIPDMGICLSLRSFLAYFAFDLETGRLLSMKVSHDEYDYVKTDDGKCYLEEY